MTPFPTLFAKSTTISNPIIYYYMIGRFRREVRDMVKDLFTRCHKQQPGSTEQVDYGYQPIMMNSAATSSQSSQKSPMQTRVTDV